MSAAKVRLSICGSADLSLILIQMNCSAIKLLNPGSCCIKTCCNGVLIVMDHVMNREKTYEMFHV